MHGKQYYLESNFKATWHKAQQVCRQKKMHLISIHSVEDQEAIEDMMSVIKFKNRIWTSGTDVDVEGHFVWSETGKPLQYTNWRRNQPDNAGKKEDCLEICHDHQWKWNDHQCRDYKTFFICEAFCQET